MKNKVIIVDGVNSVDWNKTLFTRAGLQVFSAASCDDALRIHRREEVDVIVAELGPPETGGDVLCQQIRGNRDQHQASIILICRESAEELEWAASCGADAVLTKPYDPETLLEKVGELLAVRSRRGYRVLIATEVTTATTTESFLSSSQNISVTGMLLETARMLEIGTRLTCSFSLPGSRRISVDGEVVRVVTFPTSRNQYYGVRFVKLQAETQQAIESYIGQSVVFS